MKKYRYLIVITIGVGIIFYGCILVSGQLPKFIKDKSALKVEYKLSPFDVRFETPSYSFYINSKIFSSIKDRSTSVYNGMQSKISGANHIISKKASDFIKEWRIK